MPDTAATFEFLLRWFHFLAGITWIGLLYFFNLVNVPLMKALDMFRSANGKKAPERVKIAQEIFKIMIDGQYSIGTVGQSPATMGVRIASRKMGNMASRQINAQHCRTPGTSQPSTYYFKA